MCKRFLSVVFRHSFCLHNCCLFASAFCFERRLALFGDLPSGQTRFSIPLPFVYVCSPFLSFGSCISFLSLVFTFSLISDYSSWAVKRFLCHARDPFFGHEHHSQGRLSIFSNDLIHLMGFWGEFRIYGVKDIIIHCINLQ